MSVTTVGASTSYTPGSQTCSQMASQVRAFFQAVDDPELNTVVLVGMNSAISLINSRTWKKLYSTQDITLDTTNAEYALADDFKEPIHLLLLDSSLNRKGRMDYLTNGEFYQLYPDVSTADDPECYTVDYSSRMFVLARVPASSFVASYPTLRSKYHKRLPKLTCTETLDIPPEFEEFIVTRGALWVARVRDPSKVGALRDEADERWRMLKSDDGNIQTDYR